MGTSKKTDDKAMAEARAAGFREGASYVLTELFRGDDAEAAEFMRDRLCDVIWWAKGWRAARDSEPFEITPLEHLAGRMRGLIDRILLKTDPDQPPF